MLSRSGITIAEERTGFPQIVVAGMLLPGGPRLTADNVRGIEERNTLAPGVLRAFVGHPLRELLDELAYSQAPVRLGEERALVTTAFVSALAGFLLLAEVLKEADPDLAAYRLRGVYEQELLVVPNGFRYAAPRDETGYCLCGNPLRPELYAEKYRSKPPSVPPITRINAH